MSQLVLRRYCNTLYLLWVPNGFINSDFRCYCAVKACDRCSAGELPPMIVGHSFCSWQFCLHTQMSACSVQVKHQQADACSACTCCSVWQLYMGSETNRTLLLHLCCVNRQQRLQKTPSSLSGLPKLSVCNAHVHRYRWTLSKLSTLW